MRIRIHVSKLVFVLVACVRANIQNSQSCGWHVMQKTYEVESPLLLSADVEKTCPGDRFGHLNTMQCNSCGDLHKPCEGQFAACIGCCTDSVPQSHSCQFLTDYLIDKNSLDLECDDQKDETPGQVTFKTKTVRDEKVVDEGFVESECNTEVKKFPAEGDIPVKLRFNCLPCAALGNPDILTKCCKAGLDWAATEMGGQFAGFKPFLWLDGCHNKSIVHEESGNEYPFPDSGAYASFKEKAITDNIGTHVQQKICDPIAVPSEAQITCTDEMKNKHNPDRKESEESDSDSGETDSSAPHRRRYSYRGRCQDGKGSSANEVKILGTTCMLMLAQFG